MKERNPNHLLVFMIIVLALEAIFFSVGNAKLNQEIEQENKRIENLGNALRELPLEAKAISVFDITNSKKIYGKNDEDVLPIASIAKVMTVVVALKNTNETVILSNDAIRQSGDFGLLANEKWNIKELAKLTLVSSANDGAFALAENDTNFLEKMNEKARRLGMTNTSFFNVAGLDINNTKNGAYASAMDVNKMIVYAFKSFPEVFRDTALPEINVTSLSSYKHNIKNTNIVIDKIPNLLFSKTGHTVYAEGSLAIIFKNKNNKEIAVTVLGSSFLGRFTDMEKIVYILYSF